MRTLGRSSHDCPKTCLARSESKDARTSKRTLNSELNPSRKPKTHRAEGGLELVDSVAFFTAPQAQVLKSASFGSLHLKPEIPRPEKLMIVSG